MKNLYKALLKFQDEVPQIEKNTEGYGYKYAKLEDIIKTTRPVLKDNGLLVTQAICTCPESQLPSVRTTLIHAESGETDTSYTPVAEVKLGSMNMYQSIGAGITYYRRYALAGILGIAPDDDIDANDEVKPTKTKMTKGNYAVMKKSAENHRKKGKKWEEIVDIMSENVILDTKLVQDMKKEMYGK